MVANLGLFTWLHWTLFNYGLDNRHAEQRARWYDHVQCFAGSDQLGRSALAAIIQLNGRHRDVVFENGRPFASVDTFDNDGVPGIQNW